MQKSNPKKPRFKSQQQKPPGLEYKMNPVPDSDNFKIGSGKLLNKNCIITGGDSGIGRAVAIAFAKEGADVAIMYLPQEEKDAIDTASAITGLYERNCITVAADISIESNCIKAIKKITKQFKTIDVLVNNAGVQFPKENIAEISTSQLTQTFAVNIFAMFWLTKAVLPFMQSGSCIINTTSVTAYRGSASLLDYSSTKGAIVSFTRSLSANLMEKEIRVNGVAPGPVWTPLITSTFTTKKVKTFGSDSPMKRSGQPVEIAGSYVFLASDESRFMSGQILHPNGGEIVNG